MPGERREDFIDTPVTYDKTKDEHTQILISKNIKICQGTMTPLIDAASNVAKRAHERIDKAEERLFRLDDSQVGKVTAMWDDRKAVQNYVRNGILVMVAMVLLSFVAQYFGVTSNRKEIIKDAMKEAITEMAKPSN